MPSALVFGHIDEIPVGTEFSSYKEMNQYGVHRSTMGGIAGSGKVGADSIVISGGYEDDRDEGDVIIYTGQGGRDNAGRHIKDQELIRGNLALAMSQQEGLPVRVIRGRDPKNKYAPKQGYRYDGLYRVELYWQDVGNSGYKVWRFRLEKLEGTALDKNLTPSRKTSLIQRLIRDTQLAKAVKQHYHYRCQVCDINIEISSGSYAEAAHIRPLGIPHNGPDSKDNILCLCPNHHVMFDYGAFTINDDLSLIGIEGKLYLKHGHVINKDHLAYHRQHFFNSNKKVNASR